MDNFDIEQPDIEIKIEKTSEREWRAQIVCLNGDVVKRVITLEDTPTEIERAISEACQWLK